ncbi:tRNA threonylcarbamoyladenosine biosynthesis protein TsaE [Hydrogenophaga palleronii]|uniref:tRNA threonylcarbamoyladenosine biosynthesis protein TsaE n=1 Tax=Hydrogenophaga palleronii TaxID=65655 RepID=A0ABU1WIM9_9BURK|nr:tRNA threonylcarbamoyladenosine biosynthesis protein TsaE [Hydrogenophaga palleronii]
MISSKTGVHVPTIVGTQLSSGAAGDASTWTGAWADEAGTAEFARTLATSPAMAHATLSLQGDLGAGKTTFVRHLLRALGVRGRIKSPTYAVVEPHSAIDCPLMPAGEPLAIWHFDFYRFNDPREWEDAGFRELFAAPGLKLVEWPERAGAFMPVVDLIIDIQPDESLAQPPSDPDMTEHPAEARRVRVKALTPTGHRLLEALP